MKIALAQMKLEKDFDTNITNAVNNIKQASDNNAELICFPELQLSEFFPKYHNLNKDDYAITLDSTYIKKIKTACKENNIYAVPNFYIKENNKYYDMSLLIDNNGKLIGKQKMVHIAQAINFYEQDYYTPSEEGFKLFKTPIGNIAIVVCFDRHYPESIRTLAIRGADLIIIPTANTTEEDYELFNWEIKIQSFHNSVNIAMCNRVGLENSVEYYGKSLVTDYTGKTLQIASTDEELLYADVNLELANKNRLEYNYIKLRKKEFYD